MSSKEIAELDACLKLLSPSSSDENKFVALFLLPRLLPDPNDHDKIQYAFDRMNFKFLKRLLLTAEKPDANASSIPAITLHSIAVNVLSGFCRIEALAQRKELADMIPSFDCILTAHSTDSAYSDVIDEILNCLSTLGQSSSGFDAILNGSVLVHVAQLLLQDVSEAQKALALQTLNTIFWNFQTQKVVELKDNFGGIADSIALILASILKTEKSRLKFNILSTFAVVLSGVHKHDITLPKSVWGADARDGLSQILKSKLGSYVPKRDSVLMLASASLDILGPDWLNLTSPLKGKTAEEPTLHHFAMLLVHIACAEVRVRLDEFSRENLNPSMGIITSSFRIIEAFLLGLVRADDEATNLLLPAKSLISLRTATPKLLSLYMEFGNKDVILGPIVCEGMRPLGLWLAEETEFSHSEVKSTIPVIIEVCKHDYTTAVVMAQAFVNLTSEPDIREVFIKFQGFELLFEVASRKEVNLEDAVGVSLLESIFNCMQSHAMCASYGATILLSICLQDVQAYTDKQTGQSLVDTFFTSLSEDYKFRRVTEASPFMPAFQHLYQSFNQNG
ncbi:Neurochondrin-domain-containing protein [Chytridium lagenaria]|nr:Neurochondrin-domain-containing protein [Chytridium lagenaria]